MNIVNMRTLCVLTSACVLSIGCAAEIEPGDGTAPAVELQGPQLSPDTYRDRAYTAPGRVMVNRVPYTLDNGIAPDRSASARFGTLFAGGDQVLALAENPVAIILSDFFVPAPEAKAVVTANVIVDPSSVHVVGGLIGYAKGILKLNMRVLGPTGIQLCARDVTLAQTEGAAGDHYGNASTGPLALSCVVQKQAGPASNHRVEVSLSASHEAWGAASVSLRGAVRLSSVVWDAAVEPRVIVGHQGLCLEPVVTLPSGAAVAGSTLRVGECVGRVEQGFRLLSGDITHIASSLTLPAPLGPISGINNLCISAPATATAGTQPQLVSCSVFTPRPQTQFTPDGFGRVRHNASGRCLEALRPTGGGLASDFHSAPIVLADCNRAQNQVWAIQ
jgi:hypothetical protein